MTSRMRRSIGTRCLPAVGYGAMVLSPGLYGSVDEEDALATLHHVLELGLLIDSSDVYGREFHNERLIGEALRRYNGPAVVATKFGQRIPAGAEPHLVHLPGATRPIAVNAEPRYIRQYATGS